jgi:hypothetical protein
MIEPSDDDPGDDDPFGDAIAAARQADVQRVAAAPAAGRHSVADLAAAGLTDHEIAAATGLDLATVAASPDVLVPLGPAHDARVARAIYHAAIGGERWSEKLDKFGDVQRLREHVAPDPRAASFYLENRQRSEWGGSVKEAVRVIVTRQLPKNVERAIAEANAIDVEISADQDAHEGQGQGGLSGRPGYVEREP